MKLPITSRSCTQNPSNTKEQRKRRSSKSVLLFILIPLFIPLLLCCFARYYGGWVAPNIYFMGMSGVVNFGGLRIGGLSGIYKKWDYKRGKPHFLNTVNTIYINMLTLGHYERAPYNGESLRSVYHVRELEVFKLQQLSRPIDVFLSHDWPQGIAHYGDMRQLLRIKPFLAKEVPLQ